MQFRYYLSEPEISARNAVYAGFSTPSTADTLECIQWLDLDLGDANGLYDELWFELIGQQ